MNFLKYVARELVNFYFAATLLLCCVVISFYKDIATSPHGFASTNDIDFSDFLQKYPGNTAIPLTYYKFMLRRQRSCHIFVAVNHVRPRESHVVAKSLIQGKTNKIKAK
jgi:hypothetical protein